MNAQMKKNITILFTTSILFTGCVVQPTKEGSQIRIVTEKESEGCEYINLVTGSGSMGWGTAHDAEGALNEVRNKASRLGANAIYLLDIDSNHWGTTSVAKALKCKF